jgi:hypothetical protein
LAEQTAICLFDADKLSATLMLRQKGLKGVFDEAIRAVLQPPDRGGSGGGAGGKRKKKQCLIL